VIWCDTSHVQRFSDWVAEHLLPLFSYALERD
jgi:hypothetical protein